MLKFEHDQGFILPRVEFSHQMLPEKGAYEAPHQKKKVTDSTALAVGSAIGPQNCIELISLIDNHVESVKKLLNQDIKQNYFEINTSLIMAFIRRE